MTNWINYIKKFGQTGRTPQDRSNPVTGYCRVCSRELRRMDMYSCSKNDCPTQPKATL